MAKKRKFGSPFKMSAEQARHARRSKFEVKARMIKNITKSKRPIEHIAADLSRGGRREYDIQFFMLSLGLMV